jgi:hypothetical protein
MADIPDTPATPSQPAAAAAAKAAPAKNRKRKPPPKKAPLPPKAPALAGCIFGTVVGAVLGGLLAVLHLAAAPVEKVGKFPEKPEPGKAYFVEGSRDAKSAKFWERKQMQVTAGRPGGTIKVNEAELNAWVKAALEKTPAENRWLAYEPGLPDFRIEGGRMHVSFDGQFYVLGNARPLVVQTEGSIVKGGGDKFIYVADEIYVGALRAGLLPGLVERLRTRLEAAFPAPDKDKLGKLAEGWARLTEVKLDGKALVLTVPKPEKPEEKK